MPEPLGTRLTCRECDGAGHIYAGPGWDAEPCAGCCGTGHLAGVFLATTPEAVAATSRDLRVELARFVDDDEIAYATDAVLTVLGLTGGGDA